jgi:hypothetical protein
MSIKKIALEINLPTRKIWKRFFAVDKGWIPLAAGRLAATLTVRPFGH